jgi:phosphoserine aminotransferase
LITAVTSADRVIKYLEAKGGTGVQDARNAAKAIFDPPVNQ